MKRINLSSDVSISQLVYGMWRLTEDPNHSTEVTLKKVHSCLEQGITTIDQANIYGAYTAEEEFGKALKLEPSLRDKIEIVSKCDIIWPAGRFANRRVKHYDTSPAHINESVERSLSDMHTDYLDLLLIHRPDPFMDHHETGTALDALIDSGKVRSVGVSNFRPWDFELLQSAMKHELVTNQIELSVSNHEPFVNGDVSFLQRHNKAIMAWSPLGGGSLFNGGEVTDVLKNMAEKHSSDAASVAIAWLIAHPAQIVPVLGTNNLDRIAKISQALAVDLDREDWYEIYTAALGREVA